MPDHKWRGAQGGFSRLCAWYEEMSSRGWVKRVFEDGAGKDGMIGNVAVVWCGWWMKTCFRGVVVVEKRLNGTRFLRQAAECDYFVAVYRKDWVFLDTGIFEDPFRPASAPSFPSLVIRFRDKTGQFIGIKLESACGFENGWVVAVTRKTSSRNTELRNWSLTESGRRYGYCTSLALPAAAAHLGHRVYIFSRI